MIKSKNEKYCNEIIRLYKLNKSHKEIRKITKCCFQTQVKILKNVNLYKIKKPLWTKEEIQYIKNNYVNSGPEAISEILKRPYSSIVNIACKLKLHFDRQDKLDPIQKNIEDLLKIKEFVYFLGLFYADGTIRTRKHKMLKRVTLTISRQDGEEIQWIFNNIGKFNIWYLNKKQKNHKNMIIFNVQSKKLWDFLYENDYYEKSSRSADKILSKIPEKLHYLFFRGFLDGDGCIYLSRKNDIRTSFTGSYRQDWTFIEKLCNKLKIKYSISRNIKNDGRNSSLRIFQQDYNIKLLNYIFNNIENDNIGFSRKYKLYFNFKENLIKQIDTRHGNIKLDIYKQKTKYRVYIEKNKKVYSKIFYNFSDAFEHKKFIIKKYNLLEYRLRKLLNYFDFSNQRKRLENKFNINKTTLF